MKTFLLKIDMKVTVEANNKKNAIKKVNKKIHIYKNIENKVRLNEYKVKSIEELPF
jgi:predicted ATP-grasp superfamily ATP-dependent carboligase